MKLSRIRKVLGEKDYRKWKSNTGNRTKEEMKKLLNSSPSVSGMVSASFVWYFAPEGAYYWQAVYHRVYKHPLNEGS